MTEQMSIIGKQDWTLPEEYENVYHGYKIKGRFGSFPSFTHEQMQEAALIQQQMIDEGYSEGEEVCPLVYYEETDTWAEVWWDYTSHIKPFYVDGLKLYELGWDGWCWVEVDNVER